MLYMILCDRVLLRHLMTSRDTHFGYWLVSYRSVRFCQSTGLQPAGSRRNEICTKSAAFTVRSGRSPASHSKAPNCSEDFTCAMGSSHSGHPWRREWLWSHTLTSWCGSQYCFCLYAWEYTTSQTCFLFYRAIKISGVSGFEPIPLAFDCFQIELAWAGTRFFALIEDPCLMTYLQPQENGKMIFLTRCFLHVQNGCLKKWMFKMDVWKKWMFKMDVWKKWMFKTDVQNACVNKMDVQNACVNKMGVENECWKKITCVQGAKRVRVHMFWGFLFVTCQKTFGAIALYKNHCIQSYIVI